MFRRPTIAVAVALTVLLAGCDFLAGPRVAPTPAPTVQPPTPSPKAPEASSAIMNVVIAEVASDIAKYDRDDWDHWKDSDRDCQNARQEVLIVESEAEVSFTDERECRVEFGVWEDPYTGEIFKDPGELDVDHMVPLANAHRSGGHAWSEERKELYANDLTYPGHLIAVKASAN